jgi:hypothetical protein
MKYLLVIALIVTSWAIAAKVDGPSQIVGENPTSSILVGAQPTKHLVTPAIRELQQKMDAAMARGDYALARQYDRQIVDLRYGTAMPAQPTGLPIPHAELANSSTPVPMYWGSDRLIYSGALRTFACDYDTNGTMYVAISAPDSSIKIYRSLDHGSTWSFMISVFHTPRDYYTKLGLVATQGDSGFLDLFCRHSFNNGDVYLFRFKKDFSGWTHYSVATGADTIDDFSVCEDYYNPGYYLYLLSANEHTTGLTGKFMRSVNYGKTWVDTTFWYNGYDPSISFTSQYVVLTACRLPPSVYIPNQRIYFERNMQWGGPTYWRGSIGVAADSFAAWSPCVAATNTRPDTLSTVWVLFTHNYYNGGDYDLDYAYSTNGGATFTTGSHLDFSSDDADYANVRQYRIYGTSGYPYVEACYTLYTTTTSNVYWTWASQSTPTTWNTPLIINSAEASTSLGGINMWSPHSPSLGGVVYPRLGPTNLYFDAPYLGVTEEHNSPQNRLDIEVTPNPFARNIKISYQIPNPTHVSLAIYDVNGREVKSIVNENAATGYYKLIWDGRDNNNNLITNGIYFLHLKTDQANKTTKLILTR